MKFLKSHQAQIKEAIRKAGFTMSEFNFIKRKGRILTSHVASNKYFSYFENRAKPHLSKFIPLEYKSYFEIRWSDRDKRKVAKWEDVLEEFVIWVTSLEEESELGQPKI